MKFALDSNTSGHMISSYDRDRIVVSGTPYPASLAILPEQILTDWSPAGFDGLTPDHFGRLAGFQLDILVLGTGEQHRFPHPRLYTSLVERGIALEHDGPITLNMVEAVDARGED